MRLLRLMPVALAIFLSACSNEYLSLDPDEDIPSGEVVFNLSAKVSAQTKSAVSQEENTINTDDFWIEVFNSQGIRLVSRPYSEIKNTKTSLNAGKDYRFLARHGDSLGAGFNKAFYMADTLFDVRPQNVESVKATARLANVKVAVKFDESIAKYYSDEYYAIVRHGAINKKSIRFEKDETRAGYIPAGELILEVYARLDGEWKYYACAPKVYEPQDFVTFNIETGKTYGSLDVNILVDDEVETVEENVGISAMDLATAPPKITSPKFIDDIYGIPASTAPLEDNVTISYVAEAGITSAVLSVEKDNAGCFAGLKRSIDLANLDAADRAALNAAGLFLAGSQVAGVIDFSGALRAMNASPVERTLGAIDTEFSLVVTDRRGHTDTKTISFRNPEAAVSFDIPDYAKWGWKVDGAKVKAINGDASLLALQCSSDGVNWSAPVKPVSVSGNEATFGVIGGLKPNTEYKFRTVYDSWYPVTGTIASATTEYPQQVGNAGFEEWTDKIFNYKGFTNSDCSTPYCLPWKDESSAWWDSNTMVTVNNDAKKTSTMDTKIFGKVIQGTWLYKSFPTVSYFVSGANEGSKSVSVQSVACGSAATGSTEPGTEYRGELYIGRADSETGAQISKGHEFSSRPSKMKFYYQFENQESESYYALIEVYNASGNVIGRGEHTSDATTSTWEEVSVPVSYMVNDKAASIYICFYSSTLENPKAKTKCKNIYVNGSTYAPHIGNILKLDDIQLIYE